MAGRMGNDQVTIKSLEVVKVDLENDILYIKGGVPGARNSLVFISGPGELKLSDTSVEEIVEETPVVEEAKPEAEVKAEAEAPVETKAAASAETPEAVEKEVVEAKEKIDSEKKE
jgi:large subunit ribosomal protein L3